MIEKGTSYFGVRNVSHARRDLDRFVNEGLTAILHTFSERDLAYYEGTIKRLIEESHMRDLSVYVNPWGVGRVFGGEALSEFIGRNPDAQQVLSTGGTVPAACFNNPAFREFMQDWANTAVELGADVIFWDEPHWFISGWVGTDISADAWTCHCEHCRERYEKRYGESMPTESNERTETFKEDSLLDFLDEMMRTTHEAGGKNAVCLLPSPDSDHGLSDWERLARHDHLDVFATDPYWGLSPDGIDCEEFVSEYTEIVATLAEDHNLQSQIWIQGFRLDDDPTTIEEVRTATRVAVDGGIDSVFMWGYDGCASISSIACDDPEAVWNAYLESLP